jgi:DNA-binding NarL/FixJ family response regulator
MKILLLDDHALFRAGLALLLQNLNRNITIFEAKNTQEALAITIQNPDLDLCLLDINLQNENGLTILETLKGVAENLAVVVVSACEESSVIRECIDVGAMSFISKSATPKKLAEAIKFVLAGEVSLPSQFLDDEDWVEMPQFSPRQKEVLMCLCRGLPTKSIARDLCLSEHTVKDYISSIFQILKVNNRTEAVIKASHFALNNNHTNQTTQA